MKSTKFSISCQVVSKQPKFILNSCIMLTSNEQIKLTIFSQCASKWKHSFSLNNIFRADKCASCGHSRLSDSACIARHNHDYDPEIRFLALLTSTECVPYIHGIYTDCICTERIKERAQKFNTKNTRKSKVKRREKTLTSNKQRRHELTSSKRVDYLCLAVVCRGHLSQIE